MVTNTKYTSKYTNRQIIAPNRLAEFVCENQAAKKQEELPFKFWSLSKFWEREFKRQLIMARQLVELYTEPVMMHVLNMPEARRIFSWYYEPGYMPVIKKSQDDLKKRAERLKNMTPPPIPHKVAVEAPRPSMANPKSTISKLRNLDM